MSLSEAYDDLDDSLAGEPPSWVYGPDDEPIPDMVAADRMMRRLARLVRDRDDAIEVARAQIAQVELWLAERCGELDVRIEGVQGLLARYHQAVLAEQPDRKTIELPSGELKSRWGQPAWNVTDEAELMAWLLKNAPEVIVQPAPPDPRIDKPALKAALTVKDEKGKTVAVGVSAEGEKPPGLEVLPASRGFDAIPRR